MKGFRNVVLASILVAATGTAWAVGDNAIAGTVQKVDQQNHKLTLDNGKSYSVASSVKIDNLQPGDKVNVTTDAKGTSVTRIEQTGTESAGSSALGSSSAGSSTMSRSPSSGPSAPSSGLER